MTNVMSRDEVSSLGDTSPPSGRSRDYNPSWQLVNELQLPQSAAGAKAAAQLKERWLITLEELA